MIAHDRRREFILKMGGGLSGLTVAATLGAFDPARARAEGQPLSMLDAREGAALDALGETLLPGAAAAGIAQYVDRQLGSAVPLLMLPYLDFPQPPLAFYRQGLAALETLAQARHAMAFADLGAGEQAGLVGEIASSMPQGWAGPPAPLFAFVVRNDAVDVVYGTQAGFEALDVPYMPHILPETDW